LGAVLARQAMTGAARPTRASRAARVVPFDDYVVVFGVLRPDECERLCLTHIEYDRSPISGTVWFPKEAPDAT